ncbi:hypothetical protein LCGC14_2989750 [marine sediment metagenome]|uniref:DUF7352 domain-containing protein n=1 Tax=marine sediment metagenome TaxID=412755 RepID=A0A0F8X491_9ZZZZ
MDAIVYRYQVIPLLNGMCEIDVPQGGVFLKVEYYKGWISLWYKTYKGAPLEKRRIYQAGTGIVIPENVAKGFNYLGTVIREHTIIPLVYHIFISG